MSFIVVASFLIYLLVSENLPSFLPSSKFGSVLRSVPDSLRTHLPRPPFLFCDFSPLLGLLLAQSHVVYTGKGARKDRSKAIQRFLASDSELPFNFSPDALKDQPLTYFNASSRPVGTYFLSLMICDLAPTLSAIVNLSWAIEVRLQADFQSSPFFSSHFLEN